MKTQCCPACGRKLTAAKPKTRKCKFNRGEYLKAYGLSDVGFFENLADPRGEFPYRQWAEMRYGHSPYDTPQEARGIGTLEEIQKTGDREENQS